MKVASFEKAEWIDPWRDRRPMTEDMVLVTYWFNGKTFVDTARYTKGNSSLVLGNLDTERWTGCGTVLAWMPLPEAYDPVEEDEKMRERENEFLDAAIEAGIAIGKEKRDAEETEVE